MARFIVQATYIEEYSSTGNNFWFNQSPVYSSYKNALDNEKDFWESRGWSGFSPAFVSREGTLYTRGYDKKCQEPKDKYYFRVIRLDTDWTIDFETVLKEHGLLAEID